METLYGPGYRIYHFTLIRVDGRQAPSLMGAAAGGAGQPRAPIPSARFPG